MCRQKCEGMYSGLLEEVQVVYWSTRSGDQLILLHNKYYFNQPSQHIILVMMICISPCTLSCCFSWIHYIFMF